MLTVGIMSRVSLQLERLQKWGAKGGKARAKTLSPKRRQEIAKRAAAARWGKRTPAAKRGNRR
jgi:hypothetical protein